LTLRHHAMATLVAVCLALGITPAFAGNADPTPVTPSASLLAGTPSGSASSTTTECNLGILGPPAVARNYVSPPGDEYYTLIDPATCVDCQSNIRVLTEAHMALKFATPCEIAVSLSIVPAVDLGGGCLAPDRSAPALCGPIDDVISDGGVTDQCVDYARSMPALCSIDGPAFLKIEFGLGSCLPGRPEFCGLTTCNNCTQYNFLAGGGTGLEDLCAVFPGPLKSIVMNVGSTCSAPTSTAPASWGKLKTLYR
jgi:hypothetical protein